MNQLDNRSYIYQISLDANQTNDARIIASSFIENNSTVLDVGCACGDFGSFIFETKKCNVYGMEYDKDSIKVALSLNVFEEIHQVDLNTLETNIYSNYINKFDYVTLIDVLEHTIDPKKSLLQLKPYIKEDGYFIVSLPNISFGDIKISLLNDDFEYTDMGILDKTHLRFFTYKTIAEYFTSLNLEILECKVKVANISDSEKTPFLIRRYIFNNPHSYAYQYIIKIKNSDLIENDLRKLNKSKMSIRKKDIQSELNKIKRDSIVSFFLPVGSKRRNYLKRLYNRLKGKK